MEIGGVLLRWISSREDVERLVRSVGGDAAILKVRGMVVAGCVQGECAAGGVSMSMWTSVVCRESTCFGSLSGSSRSVSV